MATTQSNQLSDAIQQIYEEFSGTLRRQAEHIEKLNQSIKQLQSEQQQLEEIASHLIEPLEASLVDGAGTRAPSPSGMLACMHKLAAATYAGQVFELLAEEAAQMNVRAVVFDIRGRAAWGFSTRGFSPELSAESLRTLLVPLNHGGPFRQVFETAGAVETNAAALEQNHNLVSRLTPAANSRILLIPVSSAGCVAAIFYADIGEKRDSALIDALKVLAEFAGAQMDRLMVVNGGHAGVEAAPTTQESEKASDQAAGGETEIGEPQAAAKPEIPPDIAAPEITSEAPVAPMPVEEQISAAPMQIAKPADEPQAAAQDVEIARPSKEEEKVHRDAKRFSKLLVSEIELYNTDSVAEGRRNKDLYQRLKKDIDRSRETYEKRFAHTVAKQFDYFHDELVRTLAESDPSVLGSGYPGPSV